ncbi:pilus assembly protein PilM [Candidatus Omnitrophota bacterium]
MKKDLTCVYFDNNKFKIARLKGAAKGQEVVQLEVKGTQDMADQDISEAIRGSLKQIGKGGQVVAAISSNLVMSKNIEVPSRDPKEIQEIINLQSSRYTPYAKEEIVTDYINIGVYRDNYTKILLIIVPRNVIKRCFDILSAAGFTVEKIFIASEGIARIYAFIAKPKSEPAPVSIVHLNDTCTDFTVFFKNQLIYVRNIPIGLDNFLSEREKNREKFIEEVKKSLESYQNEDIEKVPGKLILTGAFEQISELKDALNNTLYIPTTVMPYLEQLPLSAQVRRAIPQIKQTSLLDVLSPLFVSEQLALNLVPEEVKLKKALEQRGREIIKMGILIMTIFCLTCAILMSKIFLKSSYLESLNANYQSVNQEAQELEQAFARVQIIRGYLSGRGLTLEILSELQGVISHDIHLSNIRLGEEARLSIKGTSESMSTVFTLVSDMEKSEHFQNVKTKYTTKRKEGDKDMTDFQITCTLQEPAGQ